jgi:DNA-binding transcriptional LysR family regulator
MPNCSKAFAHPARGTEMARTTIVPALPDFMAAHPELELELSSTDRQVDLVQEGFDCVLLGARPFGWECPVGESYATLQLSGALHVNSAQTYEAAALAGLGVIQAPLLGIGRYLETGALIELLSDFRHKPLDVSLVVAHRRNLSRRVLAFMKWIENVLAPYLE